MFAGAESARAGERRATRLARRIVAPRDHHQPLLGPQQARSIVPLYRLRLPGRPWSTSVSGPDEPLEDAISIARLVRAHGGRALVVGGWVRDRVMGHQSKDVDLEVFGIEADALKALLHQMGTVHTVGESFPVYKVAGLDVSLPRRESKIGRGHKRSEERRVGKECRSRRARE